MQNTTKKIEQWFDEVKKGNTFRWLVVIGLIGVAMMLLHSFINIKEINVENSGREPPEKDKISNVMTSSGEVANGEFQKIEQMVENKIKEILEKVVGVGTVDVMVTADSTEEIVIQKNLQDSQQRTQETDANGGTRHTTHYTRDGKIFTYDATGKQTPIITKKIKPFIRGVLVVAKGAENEIVNNMMTDAVSKALNIAPTRISIVPRKQ